MDKQDRKVNDFINMIEIKSKTDFGLYSRKIEMPLALNPNPVQLEKAPPPYDSKDVAPFVSPYDNFDFHKDSIIIVASKSASENWITYSKVFPKIKIKNAILVFPEELEQNDIANIHTIFDELSENALFYWTYVDKNDLNTQIWNQ